MENLNGSFYQGPNTHLVGQLASRAILATPALVLDLTAFEKNLRVMAGFASASGCRLRPHAKAHKSVEVARRQMAVGAIGVSCATLQEAEVMAAGGIDGILITSPVAGPTMLARLMRLNSVVRDLSIMVDHPDNITALAAAVGDAERPLSVLVDYDVGQNRTGGVDIESAVALARSVAASDHLRFRGIQAYYGHLQHIADYRERAAATAGPLRMIRDLVNSLRDVGLAPEIVTGGGTGTHHIDMNDGVFTENQAGSYPFMDAQYDAIQLMPDESPPFNNALLVHATVIGTRQPNTFLVNAGWKAFATEGEPPVLADGEKGYRFMGDEHGAVTLEREDLPALGSTIIFKPPHCDPTTNLFSAFHCVRDDALVDIWPIEARGY